MVLLQFIINFYSFGLRRSKYAPLSIYNYTHIEFVYICMEETHQNGNARLHADGNLTHYTHTVAEKWVANFKSLNCKKTKNRVITVTYDGPTNKTSNCVFAQL